MIHERVGREATGSPLQRIDARGCDSELGARKAISDERFALDPCSRWSRFGRKAPEAIRASLTLPDAEHPFFPVSAPFSGTKQTKEVAHHYKNIRTRTFTLRLISESSIHD